MKLTELDAHWLGHYNQSDGSYMRDVPVQEAQGISFQCPKCAEGLEKGDGFIIGAHAIVCWFKDRVPDHVLPGPGRWIPHNQSLDTLTLTPSISLEKSCGWHGYVRDGDAN